MTQTTPDWKEVVLRSRILEAAQNLLSKGYIRNSEFEEIIKVIDEAVMPKPETPKVRMISPDGSANEISANEAGQMIQGAFMRSGNVSVNKEGGTWTITDRNGATMLTPIEAL